VSLAISFSQSKSGDEFRRGLEQMTEKGYFGSKDMEDPGALYNELDLGRRKLNTIFCTSTPQALKANEKLGAVVGSAEAVYRLRAGWACQFRELPNGDRVIVDVYIPGDIIALDAVLHTRPLGEVLTLCAVTIEEVPRTDALMRLMAYRPTALYVAWLLGQRQRRADRLLVAISSLDARGRLAMMVLEFYTRLRRRRLISGWTYNLPLTQVQMGNYLGLTVVHINRTVRSLRDERIVSLEKNCVTILDFERLTGLTESRGTASSSARGKRSIKKVALPADEAAE
jgi:CRP/FNR family transcriptional regulator